MDSPERVLIIRPSALGDVARTVPCLATLRATWPGARIDWVVNEAFSAAVASHPMLDEVVPFDRAAVRGWPGRASARVAAKALAERLRGGRYDVVYDLQGLARSGLMTWATRAPRRVGFADAREGAWLACPRKDRHRIGAPHTVDRMLGLLAADGHEPVHDMRLYVAEADQAWADRWLGEHGHGSRPAPVREGEAPAEPRALAASPAAPPPLQGGGGGGVRAGSKHAGDAEPNPHPGPLPARERGPEVGPLILAPTAQWGCKCWPPEMFAELGRRALRGGRGRGPVVVLASPGEASRAEVVLRELGGDATWPRTTVGQMMGLIRRASAVVCNDSAPLHLAVGLDVPTVAIFGPTDPALVGPYGRPESVVQPPGLTPEEMSNYRRRKDDDALIRRVPVDAVWQELQTSLSSRSL
jgi:ADP-heptose:LPS heptosyltransferase